MTTAFVGPIATLHTVVTLAPLRPLVAFTGLCSIKVSSCKAPCLYLERGTWLKDCIRLLPSGDHSMLGQPQADCTLGTKWAQKCLGFVFLKYFYNSLKENWSLG